jgi:C-terminal processing protease CtpA/Prc
MLHIRAPLALAAAAVAAALLGSTANPTPDGSLAQPAGTGAGERFDFEDDVPGSVPAGWFVPPVLKASAAVTSDEPAAGRRCVRLDVSGTAESVGNLMRTVDATAWRGKRIRFAASVRTQGAGRAQLWLRVDRGGGATGFFDNMQDRPIRSPRWSEHEIVGDVDADAHSIALGLLILGPGSAWLDSVSIAIVGDAGAGNVAPRPLDEAELRNLVAWTRLMGYVRHFHASDEAAAADWDRLAIAGVHLVEAATDAADLAARLQGLIAAVAPRAQVRAGAPPDPSGDGPPAGATEFTYWNHLGFGQQGAAAQPGIYRSWRERVPIAAPATPGVPGPGDAVVREIAPGAWCRVPLGVFVGPGGTLPRPAADVGAAAAWTPPPSWRPSARDRTTRLASVALAWNVFQHFYPYFDVVETDWDAALVEALRAAALDADGDAFGRTLRRLLGHLHDGHGFVSPGPQFTHRLPLEADWIEGALVVTRAGRGDIRPGDTIVSIDGRSVEELWREAEPLLSGATEGWKRSRARTELVQRSDAKPAAVELRRPDGSAYSQRLTPIPLPGDLAEPRPAVVAELEPGIWYVDLDRATDDDLASAMDDLARARGIVFDLRGYPRSSTEAIAHLIDEPVTCAQWHVPFVHFPDREGMRFHFSNWKVAPRGPRFTARCAFLTDGRAISYAETYLGIIEHYRLAEIVGAPTAGTNGNVNPFRLPSGHTVSWTGMRVLKHDGSRHHGVGILPTVPAARSVRGVAEGRDELLERGIELVRPRE